MMVETRPVGFWLSVLGCVWFWVVLVVLVLFSTIRLFFPSFNDDLGTMPTRRPYSWKKKFAQIAVYTQRLCFLWGALLTLHSQSSEDWHGSSSPASVISVRGRAPGSLLLCRGLAPPASSVMLCTQDSLV